VSEGFTVWFTGLSGAGKTTLAGELQRILSQHNYRVQVIDGDAVRKLVHGAVGFTKEARDLNIRYIGYAATLLASSGAVAIVAAISPYRDVRTEVRERHSAPFIEVFVDCSIDELRRRDPKGLYQRAARGEIDHLTGVSDPYEPPLAPDVHLRTHEQTLAQSLDLVLGALTTRGLIAI
jgi:adenylyl-sulfate kinase